MSFTIFSLAFDSQDVFKSQKIIGLMVAATLAFVMGLTDDAYNTRPVLKLLVQIICGIILWQGNSAITVFDIPWADAILTIVWVVGIMNSINMLDNMDGITSSVTSFILIAALGYIALHGDVTDIDFFLLLGVLASLAGFLFFNWHPSSIYMGDTGSQFLGVILAYVGIHFCWNVGNSPDGGGALVGITALLTVFALPIIDTTVVTINRLRRGQSPFVGGKDHTTHHLSYHGYKDGQVAILFSILSVIGVVAYLVLTSFFNNPESKLILGIYFVSFLLVFVRLFMITEKHAQKGLPKNESEIDTTT
jgi:UDP-GlcNAc:undecaprenyl-phosphate GlcNAc-1-phosphate transferase